MTEQQHLELQELWAKIREVLIKLGKKGDHIAYNLEKIQEGSYIDTALAWLRIFVRQEVAAYERIYKSVPETVWVMYSVTNTKGTYEQKELAAAKRRLLEMWKTRPSILHRTKVKDFKTKSMDTGRGFTMRKK